MARVSPLIKRYISYLTVERGLSANTTTGYSADLLRLQSWAARNRLTLRAISKTDIGRHIQELSKSSLNPSSINRAISSIRTFYEFLFFENELSCNPAEDIPSLKASRPIPHVLTLAETAALLSAPTTHTLTGLRDRAFLELLLAAGLRLSEAVNLRLFDITTERRLLRCTGKGQKERQLPFTPSAARWIDAYIRAAHGTRRPPVVKLFLNQGRPLTRQFAWSLIKTHALAAGILDVTPHSLRHTFATTLLNKGVPTQIVQQFLGHAHISTTEIYLSVSEARLRRTYDQHHPRATAAAHAATNRDNH